MQLKNNLIITKHGPVTYVLIFFFFGQQTLLQVLAYQKFCLTTIAEMLISHCVMFSYSSALITEWP